MIMSKYESEISRETAMRRQVYPGRVKARKMSQALADKKIELMREIGALFHTAAFMAIEPENMTLPFYEVDGSPFPITTIEPHIKEVESEIQWREYRLQNTRLGKASHAAASDQLQTMREIRAILKKIQAAATGAAPDEPDTATQYKLF